MTFTPKARAVTNGAAKENLRVMLPSNCSLNDLLHRHLFTSTRTLQVRVSTGMAHGNGARGGRSGSSSRRATIRLDRSIPPSSRKRRKGPQTGQ